MSPTARKIARLAGECESIARRLQNLIPDIQRLELDSKALLNARAIIPDIQRLEVAEAILFDEVNQ